MASVQTILGPEVDDGSRDDSFHHRQFKTGGDVTIIYGQFVSNCLTIRPYLLFPLCGNAILFRDSSWYTISFSRFYTHCLVFCFSMHSSPIVISCHCPFQSTVHTSIHLTTTACTCILPVFQSYFILHLITFPTPQRRPICHLCQLRYIFLVHSARPGTCSSILYRAFYFICIFCHFPSFLAYPSLLPSAVLSYNHPLPSLTGIVPTHLVTCLSLHQSRTVPAHSREY